MSNPLAELPKLVVWSGNDPLAVVRFQLDITTGGAAKLKFNSTAGLTMFVNGSPVDAKAETAKASLIACVSALRVGFASGPAPNLPRTVVMSVCLMPAEST